MKAKAVKYFLLFLFFVLLWAPVLQDRLHVFRGGELKGAYKLPAEVSFNFKDWFSGSYPEKKTEYLSFCFSFRPDFVRLHNQLKYWLFKTAVNENEVIGKENYIYEQRYIDEYFGRNYNGDWVINHKTTLLKQLQDSLQTRGVFLFTVFAPGKASFYPEFLPDYVIKAKPQKTNYSSYVAACQKAGINCIDMKAWFLAMKDTASYRLFPRCGIHWSAYGDFLAFDSLVKYVESNTKIDLPDVKLDSLQLSKRPRGRDYDAGDGLNLITEFFDDTLAYPFFSVDYRSKAEVSILTIGDSYYFEMFGNMSPRVFKQVDFWYYFGEFYSNDWSLKTSKEEIKEFTLKHKVVCLMYTDAGLSGFGSGYIEETGRQFGIEN